MDESAVVLAANVRRRWGCVIGGRCWERRWRWMGETVEVLGERVRVRGQRTRLRMIIAETLVQRKRIEEAQ